MRNQIAVIDLFAGPGGLAEGFSSVLTGGQRAFDIRLSVEKDAVARETLALRAFTRQFPPGKLPTEYYEYIRDPSRENLRRMRDEHSEAAAKADREAWHQELGYENREVVSARINSVLTPGAPWVLIGGPPCQAYSLVGRSRMLTSTKKQFFKDPRHTLYKEYLYILAAHRPDIFVMENVKGLLSSKLDDALVFSKIRSDLTKPTEALELEGARVEYRLFALADDPKPQSNNSDEPTTGAEFVVRCERFGAPQARHRVIIFGVRTDILRTKPEFAPPTLTPASPVTVRHALQDLPKLRSGISTDDDAESWRALLRSVATQGWLAEVDEKVSKKLRKIARKPPHGRTRGAEFMKSVAQPRIASTYVEGLLDPQVDGYCNHISRCHIPGDIFRYLFASAYAEVHRRSPKLADFPKGLLPAHANVQEAVDGRKFSDRFRVQVRDAHSSTVTSHISKDGHYFIHYDARQARSLTVREAARLQTFPDNYFFRGVRTDQYRQVGNAVPPAVAKQIAAIALRCLNTLAQPAHEQKSKASNG